MFRSLFKTLVLYWYCNVDRLESQFGLSVSWCLDSFLFLWIYEISWMRLICFCCLLLSFLVLWFYRQLLALLLLVASRRYNSVLYRRRKEFQRYCVPAIFIDHCQNRRASSQKNNPEYHNIKPTRGNSGQKKILWLVCTWKSVRRSPRISFFPPICFHLFSLYDFNFSKIFFF